MAFWKVKRPFTSSADAIAVNLLIKIIQHFFFLGVYRASTKPFLHAID